MFSGSGGAHIDTKYMPGIWLIKITSQLELRVASSQRCLNNADNPPQLLTDKGLSRVWCHHLDWPLPDSNGWASSVLSKAKEGVCPKEFYQPSNKNAKEIKAQQIPSCHFRAIWSQGLKIDNVSLLSCCCCCPWITRPLIRAQNVWWASKVAIVNR